MNFSNSYCPANSTWVVDGFAWSCACNDPYVPDATKTSCVSNSPETYTLSLAGMGGEIEPYGTVGGGNTTRIGYVSVMNEQTKQPKGGATVRITVNVDTTSGGHDHGESNARRDRGSISGCTATTIRDAYDCTTESNGYAQFVFHAPQASGTHTFTATCINPACTGTGAGNINVKVDGLWPIPDSLFYTLIEANGKVIGDNGNHSLSGNHYLTPEAASVLRRLAASYYFENKFWQLKLARRKGQYTYIPAPLLHLNDASLIWGGRFDKDGNWVEPHAGHRRGVVIDVRANSNTGAIPFPSFANFQDMVASYDGADAQVHCTKKDGQNRRPPDCIGKDGSQDSNRHMHILLLGVDQ